MVKRLHYFNPGHEITLFQENVNFTLPANVQKMAKDLCCLPLWYATTGDYVLAGDVSESWLSTIPLSIRPSVEIVTPSLLKAKSSSLPELQATPWGISPHSLHQLSKLKTMTHIPLDIPPWKPQYFELTGRQTAAGCLQALHRKLPEITLPEVPRFCTSLTEVTSRFLQYKVPCIIKTPYSSSGRGLLWITGDGLTSKEKEWISGAIRKQGYVSIEPALHKIKDFGWEFLSDGKGNIQYCGISPFRTNEKGSFLGNSIYSQDKILNELYQQIPSVEYNRILDAITGVLQETYSHLYEGCLGVDILVYQSAGGKYHLHPCVEINMRYTMGYLSLKLEKRIHPESKGFFKVTYDKTSQECFETHQAMQQSHPIQLQEGKIRKGYLSLCPVTPQTNYKAFILIE